MRMKNFLRLAGSTLLLASLTACFDDDDPDVEQPQPEPPTAPQSFQDSFGSRFAAIFNMDPFSEPVEVTQNDVPPLAPTADPIDN